jgi:hypothetical protein
MLEVRDTPSTVTFGSSGTIISDINNEAVRLSFFEGGTQIFTNGVSRGVDFSHKIDLVASGGTNSITVDDTIGLQNALITTNASGQQLVQLGTIPKPDIDVFTLDNDQFASKTVKADPGGNVTLANNTDSLDGIRDWTVTGGPGTTLSFDDSGSHRPDQTNYLITGDQVSLPHPQEVIAKYSGFGALQFSSGAGTTEVFVNSTSAPTTLIGGAGDEKVVLGGGDLDNVQNPVTVRTSGGNISLLLKDQNNTGGHTYTVTRDSVTRDGFGGVNYSGVQNLSVEGGSGVSSYDVTSTSATTTLKGGAGDDSFSIGDGDLSQLTAGVEIFGNGGTDKVFLNDNKATAAEFYVITSNSVTRDGFGGLQYNTMAELYLNGSKAGSGYVVQSTSVPTTLEGGPGRDSFELGVNPFDPNDKRTLDPLKGPVTVHGNDVVLAGNRYNYVRLGNGNDVVGPGTGGGSVFLGSGNDVVAEAAPGAYVQAAAGLRVEAGPSAAVLRAALDAWFASAGSPDNLRSELSPLLGEGQ